MPWNEEDVVEMSVKYEVIKWAVKKSGMKNRGAMNAEEIIAFKKKQNEKNSIPQIKDAEISVTQIEVMGFPVLKMMHPSKAKKANLFIIGGGMVSPPRPGSIKKAVRFAKETGMDLYVPYYPLCTDYPVTKAYEMIFETYSTMLQDYAAEDISVLGTSSGGNLALGLIAYMNATRSILPKPGYIMALSPGSCVKTEEEKKRMKELESKDIIISSNYLLTAEEVLRHGQSDVPDYMIFLQVGDFTDCPKTTFIYGSDEVLYSLAPSLEDAMKKYGVDYQMIVGEGMFHCYPVFPVCKEAKDGWNMMIRLIKENA